MSEQDQTKEIINTMRIWTAAKTERICDVNITIFYVIIGVLFFCTCAIITSISNELPFLVVGFIILFYISIDAIRDIKKGNTYAQRLEKYVVDKYGDNRKMLYEEGYLSDKDYEQSKKFYDKLDKKLDVMKDRVKG